MIENNEFRLSKNSKDISGITYNKLTAIKPLKLDNNQQVVWLCNCECGNETEVTYTNLTRDRIKSCGCSKAKDLTGQKFGKLTAIRKTGRRCNTAQNAIEWECSCECGNTHFVSSKNLINGGTKSCGCLNKEMVDKGHPNYIDGRTKKKGYKKDSTLKRTYGVSLDWYNTKLQEQNYSCAICKSPRIDAYNLAVDHNHKTGKVRGLLCNRCNMALGGLKDDISLLTKAIEYLLEHDYKEI